ncbi:MAG: hypothetical protein RSC84_04005 [Peptostreptococcaceae bacterium]
MFCCGNNNDKIEKSKKIEREDNDIVGLYLIKKLENVKYYVII